MNRPDFDFLKREIQPYMEHDGINPIYVKLLQAFEWAINIESQLKPRPFDPENRETWPEFEMSEIVKSCDNCRNRGEFVQCRSGIFVCDDDWEPNYEIMDSKLSTITAERDRMREALKQACIKIVFHGHECPAESISGFDRNEFGCADICDTYPDKPLSCWERFFMHQALSISTISEGEIYKRAFEIRCELGKNCPPNHGVQNCTCACRKCLANYSLQEARRQLGKENGNE